MKFLKNTSELKTKFIFSREGGPDSADAVTTAAAAAATPTAEAGAAALVAGNANRDFSEAVNSLPGAEEITPIVSEIKARLEGENPLDGIDDASLVTMFKALMEKIGAYFPSEEESDTTSSGGSSANSTSTGGNSVTPGETSTSIDNTPGGIDWQTAHDALVAGGVITLSSSGAGANEDGRVNEGNRTCIVGLRQSTIDGAKRLQQAIGGAVLNCTGGTETGHSENANPSHTSGAKLDYSVSSELINLTGLTTMNQPAKTMTVNGQQMTFLRHGPPDHFDVAFHA
jgi:hypothetical protein